MKNRWYLLETIIDSNTITFDGKKIIFQNFNSMQLNISAFFKNNFKGLFFSIFFNVMNEKKLRKKTKVFDLKYCMLEMSWVFTNFYQFIGYDIVIIYIVNIYLSQI